MVRKSGALYDQTYLSAEHHGRTIHRDYLGHALRWSHAVKTIRTGDVVVDVGCGAEAPLEHTIARFPFPQVPSRLTAIDMNRPAPGYELRTKWITWMWETDVMTVDPSAVGPANVVVCFEVIEHMDKRKGEELLSHLRSFLAPTGVLLLSTPAYDGVHKANNHVHEWELLELFDAITNVGMVVERQYGTFGNVRDISKAMAQLPGGSNLWNSLRDYYNDEVMSAILAPLFPLQARNVLWRLRRRD